MKNFSKLAVEVETQFLFQDRPERNPNILQDGVETELEDSDLTEQERLFEALRALAEDPESEEARLALEALITSEAQDLVERGITFATVEAYLEEREAVGPLGEDEIVSLAEDIEATVESEIEGEPLTEEESAELQTMTNREFLEIPEGDRLRLITTQNVSSAEVAAGNVTNLDFTFTFDGQYNEALWRDTTAGQTLPPEVRGVTSGGQVFSRNENSLGGEFFSEGGQRLKIHEGTNISAIETGELTAIQAQIDERLATFEAVEEGEEPRGDGEMLVARMALEHDVDPAFVMAAFVNDGHEIETETDADAAALLTPEEAERAVARQTLTAAYRAQLEHFLTDVGRAEGDFNGRYPEEETREADRLNPNFVGFFLGENDGLNEIMAESGYSEPEIEEAASYAAARRELYSGGAVNPRNAEILADNPEIQVRPELHGQLSQAVEAALRGQSRYEAVAQQVGVPWELIAAIHYRENSPDMTSGSFGTYLHNGQPLGQRTTIVPHNVLFHDWDEAAISVLQAKGPCSDDLTDMANYAERYNGMGYRNNGVTSPYVWGGTPEYTGGHYVADGVFSPTAFDQRLGVMPIIQMLQERQADSD